MGSYRRGDVYLICSDGLTDMVSEESIAGVLGSVSAEEAAEVLAQMALDNGGRDNVTVIVCGREGSRCDCTNDVCRKDVT